MGTAMESAGTGRGEAASAFARLAAAGADCYNDAVASTLHRTG
jgi:hypothetical protein